MLAKQKEFYSLKWREHHSFVVRKKLVTMKYFSQGWGFALSLIRSSLFALSLKIAHFKERLWAICSRRSLQKSEFHS